MTQIKPESVAVVFTGKAYARVPTDFETTQLQAREVEPFILRSVKK